MGAKTNLFVTQILKHIFINDPIEDIGDAAGLLASATEGFLYIRLYKDTSVVDEGNIGDEADYPGYIAGGIAVERDSANWDVTGSNVSNKKNLDFGECTSGSQTIRYAAVWKDNVSSSDNERLLFSRLTVDLPISANKTPQIPIGGIDLNEN